MVISRRNVLKSVTGLSMVFNLPNSFGKGEYPNSLIKIVIPSPPGANQDTMMRVIGEKLSAAWGQPVIVDSKAGAAGALAASYVAKTPADGYTLLLEYSAFLSNTVLQQKPGYKLDELAPVCMLALTPLAIGVRSSLGAKTLKDYIALAKSRPGKLSFVAPLQ